MSDPRMVLRVDQVTIDRGETLTVWLNAGEGGARDAVQVELRVRPDGVREIFVDAGEGRVSIREFKDWKAMP